MKITRNNYELFFMDYLDGKLSDAEINMLEKFLLANPDLREELEGAEKFVIDPEDIAFDQKDLLLKPDLALPVTKNNFEDFCIAASEGDLDDLQHYALMQYIDENKNSEKTFKLFNSLRLSPDMQVQFPGKGNLKKSVFLIRREILYPVLSIAAAVAFLLVVYLNRENASSEIPGISANVPTEETIQPAVITKEQEATPVEEPLVQNAAVIAYNFQKEKKQSTSSKAREIPASIKEENKSKNQVPQQKLNPPVEIKLPSIAENEISVPRIEGNKIAYSPVKVSQPSQEYLTLPEYARKQVTEKILGNKSRENVKLSGWLIAETGISGINKLTGSKMKLETKTAENGDVKAYSFSSKLLSFSSTAVK